MKVGRKIERIVLKSQNSKSGWFECESWDNMLWSFFNGVNKIVLLQLLKWMTNKWKTVNVAFPIQLVPSCNSLAICSPPQDCCSVYLPWCPASPLWTRPLLYCSLLINCYSTSTAVDPCYVCFYLLSILQLSLIISFDPFLSSKLSVWLYKAFPFPDLDALQATQLLGPRMHSWVHPSLGIICSRVPSPICSSYITSPLICLASLQPTAPFLHPLCSCSALFPPFPRQSAW